MPPAPDEDREVTDVADVRRRTWLAAERTWLAWWRTGIGVAAVSLGVGRLLPGLKVGAGLSLKLLGLGYGVLAVAVLLIGAARQSRVADALRRGTFDHLSSGLVNGLTAAAVALGVATIAVVAAAL